MGRRLKPVSAMVIHPKSGSSETTEYTVYTDNNRVHEWREFSLRSPRGASPLQRNIFNICVIWEICGSNCLF